MFFNTQKLHFSKIRRKITTFFWNVQINCTFYTKKYIWENQDVFMGIF